nr:MAG TPA: ASCH domain protein [Caudoviricetes sp.]
MAIKPILFNTEMVRAILDGRKDATRRIVKGFIHDDAVWGYTAFTPKGYISCRGTFADGYGEKFFKLPCEPGDILYVRETWKKAPNGYYYYEDWQRNDIADVTKWHPSIHMPKEAARIWLKVTDVTVERLQEITMDGCHREGINIETSAVTDGETLNRNHDFSLEKFETLWDSTVKKSDLDSYGWDASPWVWVIEFERCEKPEGV